MSALVQSGGPIATEELPPLSAEIDHPPIDAPSIDPPPMSIPPASLVPEVDLAAKIPSLYANQTRKAPSYRFLRLCIALLSAVAIGLDVLGLLLIVDAVRAAMTSSATFLDGHPLQTVVIAAATLVIACVLHVISGCAKIVRQLGRRIDLI